MSIRTCCDAVQDVALRNSRQAEGPQGLALGDCSTLFCQSTAGEVLVLQLSGMSTAGGFDQQSNIQQRGALAMVQHAIHNQMKQPSSLQLKQ